MSAVLGAISSFSTYILKSSDMDTKKQDPTLQPYLPGDIQQKSEVRSLVSHGEDTILTHMAQIYSRKKPNEILGDAQSGKAQSKKDNTALREASMISWSAASQPYEAGEGGKDRQARLQTIFARVDKVGLRPEKTVIDARDGQNQGLIRPGGGQSWLGYEGIGSWSAREDEQG
jgi:hypothetical protein